MTITELHQNEELRNAEFPVTKNKVFMAHAAVCPLPHRVSQAMQQQAQQATQDEQEQAFGHADIKETRATAARLIGADAGEVALVGPTSLALSFVAAGLEFRRSANIVIYYDDYPSNVYPWMALAEKGVEVRLMNIRKLGQIRDIDVLGQIDENTALVALASCHFISGWRIDINAIGKALREREILFCVDAIQTLGVYPINAKYVDFLAADAHKWMLGPCAAGLLYVREEIQEHLKPTVFGWHNVRCPDFIAQEQINHPPDARRYEAGSFNISGYCGFKASMELLMEVGVENIANELLRQRNRTIPRLQEQGWDVLSADAPEKNQSGIVSFRRENCDMTNIQTELLKHKIDISLRTDRERKHYLRISPHFYNTDQDIDQLLDALKELT